MILRKAQQYEAPEIWNILRGAIEKRKQDGSLQWQDGYPNSQTVSDDLKNGYAYVLVENESILAYAAIIFGIEPAYESIEGNWLSDGPYVVVHRVATSESARGKGVATRLLEMVEPLSLSENVYSIKIDTNFDNLPMMKILDKLNYTYCGEVYFRGSTRRAYEKVLLPEK